MKNDFQVNIARAGDNEIALTLFGKNFPPAGQRLASPRAVPQLDAALID